MEIFIPVFVALLLHSGIIRLLDEIQMYFVSKRVSEKVYDLMHEADSKDYGIDEDLDNIIAILNGEKYNKEKKKHDPNGEWRYLD